jgi:hypothetical protein
MADPDKDLRRGQNKQRHVPDAEPQDRQEGEWSLKKRIAMNNRFVRRVERAISLGLERRPGGDPAQAA